MPLKVRDLEDKLREDGWSVYKNENGRRYFEHPTKPGVVIVEGSLDDDVPPEALQNILDSAQLDGAT